MRWKDITGVDLDDYASLVETASCGGTSAGNIATSNSLFGGKDEPEERYWPYKKPKKSK
jgi:hypothetical protein